MALLMRELEVMPQQVQGNTDEVQEGTLLCNGRFEVHYRVGQGGFATVYQATDHQTHAKTALKILSSSKVAPHQQDRFENEARIGALLSPHPAIVRPLEIGNIPELGGRPYLAMEFVRAPTLKRLSLVHPLAPAKACSVIFDITEALTHLHQQGIIHRDVKPTNIIVEDTPGTRARLIDFGFAFALKDAALPQDRRITRTYDLTGTRHYMAPEQGMSQPPAPAADVYALACSLYHALVGGPPYASDSADDVLRRKIDRNHPEFSIGAAPTAKNIPAGLAALVDAGMRRNPQDRPSMAEFGARLKVFARGGIATAAVPTTETPKAPYRHGRWLAAVLVALPLLGLALHSFTNNARVETDTTPRLMSTVQLDPAEEDPVQPKDVASVQPPKVESTNDPIAKPAMAPEGTSNTTGTPDDTEGASDTATEPPTKKRARAKKAPKPRAPQPPAKVDCADILRQASAARLARQWDRLLTLTRRAKCWKSRAKRTRLRAHALYGAQRFEQCVKFARGVQDPAVKKIADRCSKQGARP